jgi:hypothetical protein
MRFSGPRSRPAALLALVLIAAPTPLTAQIAAEGEAPSRLTAPPASAGEAAYDLRQIIGRYFAMRGPAYGELQSVHERFYVETQDGGRRPGQLWMDRQGRLRRETVADGARRLEIAGPDGAWRTAADGGIADDPGAAERARRYALVEFGDAFTGRGGASVALAGTADVEDHTWAVVRITFGDADAYEALIDAATGGLGGYRITEGGVTRLEMFGQWQLVDGVRMPFTKLVRAGAETGMQISAIDLNRDLDPTLFQKPAG